MTKRRWLMLALGAAAVLLIVGRAVAGVYADYLWYESLGSAALWRTRLVAIATLRIGSVLAASRLGVGKQLSTRLFVKVDAGLCALTGGTASNGVGQTLGVSMDYRLRRGLLGSVSSAPSTNGATCANQAAGRGAALTPRQWGVDFSRIWRF